MRTLFVYTVPGQNHDNMSPGYRVFGLRAKSHLYESELYDRTSASLTLKWFSSVTPGTFSGIAPRLWCDSFLQNLLHFISHTIVRRCECTMYSWRIRDQLDVTSYYVLFHFFYAQHVSDINTSIIRSRLKLASACYTDTTPTQPHRNSNTHRNKNTRPMWW